MELKTHTAEGAMVVEVEGPIRGEEIRPLEEALGGPEAAGAAEIRLDMSAVRFMDSIAIGRLVALGRNLQGRGKRVVFARLSTELRRLFGQLSLGRVFEVWGGE